MTILRYLTLNVNDIARNANILKDTYMVEDLDLEVRIPMEDLQPRQELLANIFEMAEHNSKGSFHDIKGLSWQKVSNMGPSDHNNAFKTASLKSRFPGQTVHMQNDTCVEGTVYKQLYQNGCFLIDIDQITTEVLMARGMSRGVVSRELSSFRTNAMIAYASNNVLSPINMYGTLVFGARMACSGILDSGDLSKTLLYHDVYTLILAMSSAYTIIADKAAKAGLMGAANWRWENDAEVIDILKGIRRLFQLSFDNLTNPKIYSPQSSYERAAGAYDSTNDSKLLSEMFLRNIGLCLVEDDSGSIAARYARRKEGKFVDLKDSAAGTDIDWSLTPDPIENDISVMDYIHAVADAVACVDIAAGLPTVDGLRRSFTLKPHIPTRSQANPGSLWASTDAYAAPVEKGLSKTIISHEVGHLLSMEHSRDVPSCKYRVIGTYHEGNLSAIPLYRDSLCYSLMARSCSGDSIVAGDLEWIRDINGLTRCTQTVDAMDGSNLAVIVSGIFNEGVLEFGGDTFKTIDGIFKSISAPSILTILSMIEDLHALEV